MQYKIIPTFRFEKDLRFYIKKRKYRNIMHDIEDHVSSFLKAGQLVGEALSKIGLPKTQEVYKARAANTDIKVGKSNGYRIIYHVDLVQNEVYYLTVYSKADREDIPESEILELINKYLP